MDPATQTAPATNLLLEWALCLAAMDWPVFPLRPGTKRQPAIKDWERRATTDPDRIRRCWTADAWNIGLATGPAGLVVVDLDHPKNGDPGPDGATALQHLATERGGPLPTTYTVATPSGGRHLYYQSPAGVRLRNSQSHIASHVDIRAGGGYVVAPGSITPQGGYELLDDRDPTELPAWLVQAATTRTTPTATRPVHVRTGNPTAYGFAALRGECDKIRAAPATQHNDTLSRAAFTIGRKVGAGLIDPATARADLIAAGETLIGDQHWPPNAREVARVVDAALAKGSTNPVPRKEAAA